jgi:hypothetical protein
MVDEPWEILWDQAMIALDSLRGYASIDWAFGGGTAMRLFFDHRESKDIDIFLNDATVLNGLSPRVNDTVGEMNVPYTEQSNFLKLTFPVGEIDFILGARLLRDIPYESRTIRGREASVETPIEVVAKKCFYRAADFTVRDVFDLAVVLEKQPHLVEKHRKIILAKRDILRKRLDDFAESQETRDVFHNRMAQIKATPAFESTKATALDRVTAFFR